MYLLFGIEESEDKIQFHTRRIYQKTPSLAAELSCLWLS